MLKMSALTLNLDGDNAFSDWADRFTHHVAEGMPPIRVAVLDRGMQSGAPSVMLGVDIGAPGVVMAETSANLLVLAADVIRARHPDHLGPSRLDLMQTLRDCAALLAQATRPIAVVDNQAHRRVADRIETMLLQELSR
jgi:hypothetical protein